MAARLPPAGVGTDGIVSAVVAVVVTSAATATSCRDPAATFVLRGGSIATIGLPATCGALDERRLVGTDAPDMSAMACASSGTVGATLRTKTQDQAPAP
jgi:hypothetical protein